MSQSKAILTYLQSGGKLTGIDALKLFQCFRLAARIHELKEQGHRITSSKVTRNGKTYAEYKLEVVNV